MQTGIVAVTTVDGVIALRGGIPLVEGGKIIAAVGGAGSRDDVMCTAGADTVNK